MISFRTGSAIAVVLAAAACTSHRPTPRPSVSMNDAELRCVSTAAFPPVVIQHPDGHGLGSVSAAIASASGASPLLCVTGARVSAYPVTPSQPIAATVLLDASGNSAKGPLLVGVLGTTAATVKVSVGGDPTPVEYATSAGVRLFWASVRGSAHVQVLALDGHDRMLGSVVLR